MSVIQVNSENYKEIENGARPALLDFYASWCGPCRMLSPTISAIASEREDIVVGKINVDDSPELARRFGIYSIPTVVVLKDGEEIERVVGLRPKEQLMALLP